MGKRSNPALDLVTRSFCVRLSSVNEQKRTIGAGTGYVLGSTRELRVEGGTLVGRNYFSKRAEDAWEKVREGHITDNSVGYRVTNYTDIQPGQSAVINGKTYTAGNRVLRISTEWAPYE